MDLLLHNSSLFIEDTDIEINHEHEFDVQTVGPMLVYLLLTIPANVTIIIWIKIIKDRTLIDSMILLDCTVNIALVLLRDRAMKTAT